MRRTLAINVSSIPNNKKEHCAKNARSRSFSGPYFPTFGLNTEIRRVNLRFSSKCGKIRSRKTLNTDTLHAVIMYSFAIVIPSEEF